MNEDAALTLSERLRTDLKAAMRTRNNDETRVLRALLGAIDNAQAVPLDAARKPADSGTFGDASNEVPRRHLTPDDVAALLAREIEERETAAAEMERLGQAERAALLRAETAIVQRYSVGGA